MDPTRMLMAEHRLIERMLVLLDREAQRIPLEGRVDTDLIATAVDFIRFYADRTHHGKEEAILFRRLGEKDLRAEHRALLEELLEDHDFGRRTVGELVEAARACANEPGRRTEVKEKLQVLTAFYRQHIRKEDEIFFPASLDYLDEGERVEMIAAFHEADRRMIHAKYGELVDALEQG